ncbi:MAG: four helix bundle protein [Ginsengibacter sp.]
MKLKRLSIRIIHLYKYLKSEHSEFILSKQIMRSGTSIGAMSREASQAESRKDFIHKLSIALKEAYECQYWLELLAATNFINNKMFTSINGECIEIIKVLTSIIKTSKKNNLQIN